MTVDEISDEEHQLYFNYLMENDGLSAVQDYIALMPDEKKSQYSAEELALEVV